VENESSQNPSLLVTLNLQNFNTSSWTVIDGSEGVWLGLGYNATNEEQSPDFTLCYYNYTNSSSDQFTCKDAQFN
jgi:hypothetical protein